MFDLHTVHLKCFCSFMCPLNVFQTYIKNFNRKLFPGGRHTQDRWTDRQTDGQTESPPPMSRFPSGARQKLYSTPLWHGARTCTVLRKYSNAFSSYSAKTKCDRQTNRQCCNISRPGPLARREIKIHVTLFTSVLSQSCLNILTGVPNMRGLFD